MDSQLPEGDRRERPPRAARHTCLDCGESYWLSAGNYDGWGTVCPHCGVLS